MERHPERVTTGSEDVAVMTIYRVAYQLVMAGHRRHHLLPVAPPPPPRVRHLREAERHRSRRPNGPVRPSPRPICDQPLVVAEHQRFELAQRRPWFDPEVLAQVLAGGAISGEGIGLAAGPVQRRHQQRPQSLAERMGSRQFGEPPMAVGASASTRRARSASTAASHCSTSPSVTCWFVTVAQGIPCCTATAAGWRPRPCPAGLEPAINGLEEGRCLIP